jgi:hypothetical protein
MESEASVPGNVGRRDESIRVGAVVVLVVGILAARGLDVNWAPMLVLAAFVLIAYLLLTSFAHVDPIYMITGVDTRHHHRKR